MPGGTGSGGVRQRLTWLVVIGLLTIAAGFGVWAWWYLPEPFRDTAKRVASTRPVDQAIELTDSGRQASQLATDLSTRAGSDWSSFLGPAGDGTTAETVGGIPDQFLIRWHCSIGEGFAAPAITFGRTLVLDRVVDRIRCRCLQSETGRELWQFSYLTDYHDKQWNDNGPRTSPISDGTLVYLYGPEGMLHCLRLSDGALLWKCDTVGTFGVVQNIFGVGSTPVLCDDLLLVQVGGSPAGSNDKDFMTLASNKSAIVAFDKVSGKVKYQAGNELASYASPQLTVLNGRRLGLLFARGGILGFDCELGNQLFHQPYRSRSYNSVNASNLLLHDKQMFVTESYETGSALYQMEPGGLKQIWSASPRDKNRGVACHWSTPVRYRDVVFGCASRHRNDAELRCIDWSTGNVKWKTQPSYQGEIAGRGSLILTGDDLLYYWVEEGWLFIIRATEQKYDQLAVWDARTELPLLKQPCWTAPVMARGLLYLRGQGALLCVEPKCR